MQNFRTLVNNLTAIARRHNSEYNNYFFRPHACKQTKMSTVCGRLRYFLTISRSAEESFVVFLVM